MRNERLHVNLTARQHLNHRGPPTIIFIIIIRVIIYHIVIIIIITIIIIIILFTVLYKLYSLHTGNGKSFIFEVLAKATVTKRVGIEISLIIVNLALSITTMIN